MVGMSTDFEAQVNRRGKGSSDGGQFDKKTNSAPPVGLVEPRVSGTDVGELRDILQACENNGELDPRFVEAARRNYVRGLLQNRYPDAEYAIFYDNGLRFEFDKVVDGEGRGDDGIADGFIDLDFPGRDAELYGLKNMESSNHRYYQLDLTSTNLAWVEDSVGLYVEGQGSFAPERLADDAEGGVFSRRFSNGKKIIDYSAAPVRSEQEADEDDKFDGTDEELDEEGEPTGRLKDNFFVETITVIRDINDNGGDTADYEHDSDVFPFNYPLHRARELAEQDVEQTDPRHFA